MNGTNGYRVGQADLRIPCTSLFGEREQLIVVADEVGLVLVLPPAATAVLGPPQAADLRTALDGYLDRRQ